MPVASANLTKPASAYGKPQEPRAQKRMNALLSPANRIHLPRTMREPTRVGGHVRTAVQVRGAAARQCDPRTILNSLESRRK